MRADALFVEPDCLHEPDLLQALLDAQFEEECGQQHRGKDQERAEVGEVLAEIGRALRRREIFGTDGAHGEPHRQRIDAGAQRFSIRRGDLLQRTNAGRLNAH